MKKALLALCCIGAVFGCQMEKNPTITQIETYPVSMEQYGDVRDNFTFTPQSVATMDEESIDIYASFGFSKEDLLDFDNFSAEQILQLEELQEWLVHVYFTEEKFNEMIDVMEEAEQELRDNPGDFRSLSADEGYVYRKNGIMVFSGGNVTTAEEPIVLNNE